MNTQHLVQINKKLLGQQKILCVLTSALVLIIALLSFGIARIDQTTIIVPSTINKQFQVSNSKPSLDYLELLSRDIVGLLLNITPINNEYSKQSILKITDPSFHGQMNVEIDGLVKDLKERNISLSFATKDILVDIDQLAVEVHGILESRIGFKVVSTEKKKYQIRFKYNNSTVSLIEFFEVEDVK